MAVVKIIVIVIQVIVSLGMIISVLLHSGKGGGLSSVLGGASSPLGSGSYIVEKNLDRITVVMGSVFAASTVALVYLLKP